MALHCLLTLHRPREPTRNFELDVELISPLNVSTRTQCDIKTERVDDCNYSVNVLKGDQVISKCDARVKQKAILTDAVSIETVKSRCRTRVGASDFYSMLRTSGFNHGPHLQGVKECFTSHVESLARIEVPDAVMVENNSYAIHPAVLDMLFQSVASLLVDDREEMGSRLSYLPQRVEGLVVHGPAVKKMYAYFQLYDKSITYLECGGALLDENGHVLVECRRYVLTNNSSFIKENMFHVINWEGHEDPFLHDENQVATKRTCIFSKDESMANLIANAIDGVVAFATPNSPNGHQFLREEQQTPNNEARMVVFLSQFDTLVYCWGFRDVVESARVDEIDQQVKLSTNGLRNIYSVIQVHNLQIAVVVVTFRTHCGIEDLQLNVVGSELWGMTRCLQREALTSITPLLLVDVATFSREEISNLVRIILYPSLVKCREIALRKTKVYFNSIQVVGNSLINARVRTHFAKPDTPMRLRSDQRTELVNVQCVPWAVKPSTSKRTVKISVTAFRKHELFIFPKTLNEMDCKPLRMDLTNYVTAVDFSGQIMSKNSQKFSQGSKVIICFPTILQTAIDVPTSCVLPLKNVPKECRNCLSLYVLIWDLLNVKTRIKAKDRVTILHDAETTILATILVLAVRRYTDRVVCSASTNKIAYMDEGVADIILDLSLKRNFSINFDDQRCRVLNLRELYPPGDRGSHWMNGNYLEATLPKVISWIRELKKAGFLMDLSNRETAFSSGFTDTVQLTPQLVARVHFRRESSYPVSCDRKYLFDNSAIYIVVGGHTGLGREIVKFLARRDAGYIAIMSRRKPGADETNAMKILAEECMSSIIPVQADVTDYPSLLKGVNQMRFSYPGVPIKGIFVGAMVLADGLVQNQTCEKFRIALDPKVLGTLHLHLMTEQDPLDYFVMHSSIVAALGNAGQSNYGAGNSFMDAFAFYRRQQGLAGQTINWGPLALGALEGRENLLRIYARQGMEVLSIPEIHYCLESVLLANLPQVIVWNVRWKNYIKSTLDAIDDVDYNDTQAAYRTRSLVAETLKNVRSFDREGPRKDFTEEDKRLPTVERNEKMKEFLKYQLGEILVADIASLPGTSSLVELGLDSALAVETRTMLLKRIGYDISVMTLLSDSISVESLAYDINSFVGESQFQEGRHSPSVSDATTRECAGGKRNKSQASSLGSDSGQASVTSSLDRI